LGRSTKIKERPVLEPSVFHDESIQGWTVVRRRRWSPAIRRAALDPKLPHFSILLVMAG
jgi:hypothetical protein